MPRGASLAPGTRRSAPDPCPGPGPALLRATGPEQAPLGHDHELTENNIIQYREIFWDPSGILLATCEGRTLCCVRDAAANKVTLEILITLVCAQIGPMGQVYSTENVKMKQRITKTCQKNSVRCFAPCRSQHGMHTTRQRSDKTGYRYKPITATIISMWS